jgi:hypothetical protein
VANRLRELPSPLFCLGGASSPGSCGGAVDYRVVAKREELLEAFAAGDAHDIELAEKALAFAEQQCAETSRAKAAGGAKGGTCTTPHPQPRVAAE